MTVLDNFYSGQIGTSATDIATTDSNQRAYVGQLSFTNTSTSSVLVTVYLLLTSATETSGSGGNWLLQKNVQPSEIWNPLQKTGALVMDPSFTLSATAATGSVIWCSAGGTLDG